MELEAWLVSWAEFAIAEQHRKLIDRLLFERESAIFYLASLERDRIKLKQQGIDDANSNAINETAASIVEFGEAINMVQQSPDMVPYDFVHKSDAAPQKKPNILRLVHDAARTLINADRRDLYTVANEQRLIAQYKERQQ